MRKVFFFLLLAWGVMAVTVTAQPLQIEVFDVTQSKVVKTVPLDEKTKSEALKLVKSTNALYPKLNPTPKTGFMLKVPLEPEENIDTIVLKQTVKQVIFIFPEGEKPYLLIFNEKEQPMFYYFSEDFTEFLEMLGIKR
ncbi:hypothetical protein M3936_05605 [Sutcliffiella horikoshii]|uniref:hypothetical protein n=1 Tax=Sutcliffiella horikoshii TaxID=79883 RepID=UPI00203ECACF|nr:hypothetical protein [Sutcliffiella horikoshii]MCM3617060.1 hypothetical protein [Sutcliffiella horikoshii]